MSSRIPESTKALVLRESSIKSRPLYHDAVLIRRQIPPLKEGQILVKMAAVGFNHKDLWIRKGQYPRITFDSVFGGDGVGDVVAAADKNDRLMHRRVFLVPTRGWDNHPDAPESQIGILGGAIFPPSGTFSEYVVVEREHVILSPDYLDDVHAAAWPLAGVTAWRATIINARVERGQNVLITGTGGGVALTALQLCVAKGANVYVTSGSEEKIKKAIALGAKAGVNYKNKHWPSQLEQILNEDGVGLLSSVIDSAGGEIMQQTSKLLKDGGRVVCYGMTADPKVTFRMPQILKNLKLIGSTMGSRQDLIDATTFLADNKIVPVVSHVIDGLECADDGFNLIKRGEHFGAVVIKLRPTMQANL